MKTINVILVKNKIIFIYSEAEKTLFYTSLIFKQ